MPTSEVGVLEAGPGNSESSKSRTNEYKFAAGRKSLFCCSLEKIWNDN